MDDSDFFNPDYTPPAGFHFSVSFESVSAMDTSFQEVSGLKLTLTTEQVADAGENSFVRQIPTTPTFSNLILKRCLLPNPHLEKWCRDAFQDFKFVPKNLRLSLLDNNGKSLASWYIDGAYPVSWELTVLNSTSNDLAIETLELKYRHFKRER